jgi:tetratricopeptide (TPR) repeat protein
MNTNTAITYILVTFWAVLLIFGVLTLIRPGWLEEISSPGKYAEAIIIKNAGDKLLKSNKFNEAVKQYTKALTIVPDLEDAIANLAVTYQKMGYYDKAIISFNYLIKLDIKHPNIIYYNLGNIYEKTDQPINACECYLLSANLSGFPDKSFAKAGQICMEQKEWEKAINYFKLAIENRKSIENSYRGMLITYQKDYADTSFTYMEFDRKIKTKSYLNDLTLYDEKIFNEQLNHEVELAKAYNNIGYCMIMQGQYKEAKEYLQIAIKIYPSYTVAINNLKIADTFLGE